MTKITLLHTADWHLGQRFLQQDRLEEHRLFLDFLLHIMQERQPDIFLHAGDIFDTGTPPAAALELYYDFLSKASSLENINIILTGGNHDSPSTLAAPKQLLARLRCTVVPMATSPITDELVPCYDAHGKICAVVAAVPFLRDKDVHYYIAGEEPFEREQRIAQAIADHYAELATIAQQRFGSDIPLIASGHLFASGAIPSDNGAERSIHVGTLGNISASAFPDEFAYVALGHLHRPQLVGKQERIRYCGSPIPLSFSEERYEHGVYMLTFEGNTLVNTEFISFPPPVPLLTIRGTESEIQTACLALQDGVARFLRLVVHVEIPDPQLRLRLRTWLDEHGIIAKDVEITTENVNKSSILSEHETFTDSTTLTLDDVFRTLVQEQQLSAEDESTITAIFTELKTSFYEAEQEETP